MFNFFILNKISKDFFFKNLHLYILNQFNITATISDFYDFELDIKDIIYEFNILDCKDTPTISVYIYIHHPDIKKHFHLFDFLIFINKKMEIEVLLNTKIDSYTYVLIDFKHNFFLFEEDGTNEESCIKMFSKQAISKKEAIKLII